MTRSERILQSQLNNAWSNRSLVDDTQLSARENRIVVDDRVGRYRELRVVENVKELGAELDALALGNVCDFPYLKIEVQLVGAANDPDTGVPEVERSIVANGRRRAECRGIEEALQGSSLPLLLSLPLL